MVVGCFAAPGETAVVGWIPRSDSSWAGGSGGEIPCNGELVTIAGSSGSQPAGNAIDLSVTWDGAPGYFYAAFFEPSDSALPE